MAKGDRLANGSYRILLANSGKDNDSLALEAGAGSDARGANVTVQKVADNDGQYFHVFSRGAEQVIFVPASGRAVDVEGQTMRDGTNVRQWDSWPWDKLDYDGEGHPNVPQILGQTWDIRDTGQAVSLYGGSYPVYRAYCHKDNKYCMEVAGTSPKAGDNVDVWTESTADAAGKGWVFLPIPTVHPGIYSVRSAIDASYCMSIGGHSTADGANCTIWRWQADANELAFKVETDDRDVTTFESLLRAGQCLNLYGGNEIYGGSAKVPNGARVQWYGGTPGTVGGPSTGPGKGDYANWWVLQPDNRTCKVNGVTYPTFRIAPRAAENKCLDVANGKAELATAFQVWDRNYTLAQAFCLVPAEKYVPTLGAPSAIRGFQKGLWQDRSALQVESSSVVVCPSWAGNPADKWDCRYRTRSHGLDGSVGEWGKWTGLLTASTGNDGWAPVWTEGLPNLTKGPASIWDGRTRSTDGVTVNFSGGKTWVDIEFQVRRKTRVGSHAGDIGHGPAASGIVAVRLVSNVSLSGLKLMNNGLWVSASVSVDSSAVDLTVGDIAQTSVLDAMAGDQAFSVPPELWTRVPEKGESVKVTATMWTPDGSTKTVSKVMQVVYASPLNTTLNPTVNVRRDPQWTATLSGVPSGYVDVYLVVRRGHGGRLVQVDPANVPYPLGVEWELFGTYFAATSTGSTSGIWRKKMAAVSPYPARMLWDFEGVPGRLALVAQADGLPEMSQSLSPEAEAHVTAGRERPVYTVGPTTKSSLSCSGAIVPALKVSGSTRDAADGLAHAARATFRRPDGVWAQVVVTGVEMSDAHRKWTKVSVTQSEESRGTVANGVGLV